MASAIGQSRCLFLSTTMLLQVDGDLNVCASMPTATCVSMLVEKARGPALPCHDTAAANHARTA